MGTKSKHGTMIKFSDEPSLHKVYQIFKSLDFSLIVDPPNLLLLLCEWHQVEGVKLMLKSEGMHYADVIDIKEK